MDVDGGKCGKSYKRIMEGIKPSFYVRYANVCVNARASLVILSCTGLRLAAANRNSRSFVMAAAGGGTGRR